MIPEPRRVYPYQLVLHAPSEGRMKQPIFELWLSACIVLGIAVIGPVMMLLMNALVERAVARGWLERASAAPDSRAGMEDLKFMASFVLVTGLLATSAQ